MNQRDKINCSVGILTLNSEKGLPACLVSLKDFAEIIVCDGNSTDMTREIAERAGAKVIKQYETDIPNLPCIKDKAGRREKNMRAATKDWYFYMDADDTLSPEVVEEIRGIVHNPSPEFLIYRMPTRIFFEEENSLREIKHEATYPSYQTRLVHKSVDAHFRGDVHDRLAFDLKKFPVGTMKSYYNFHWPEKRVQNFWAYIGRYADWELEVSRPNKLGNFLYWDIYRRLRTIFGYLFWRLPAMYAKYGGKESMPLSIELTIVRYHFKILFGSTAKYMTTRHWWIYVREIMKGKDTNRVLTNLALMNKDVSGEILDIGGGGNRASHYRFLGMNKWHKVTTVDISPSARPDHVMNVEESPLPFDDNKFDYVLLMNVLEHLNKRAEVLSEIRRVAKGELVGVIPFLVNVHPDPHDYVRLTNEGLKDILQAAGFGKVEILPVGKGPFTAGYYQFEYIVPRIFRIILGPIACAFDGLLSLFVHNNLAARFPLSYVFTASK